MNKASSTPQPDGFGVTVEDGKVQLVKYMPASGDNCPMGTKEILIAEKKVI